jgi:hypothetical protein
MGVALSPDGRHLISTGGSYSLEVWDMPQE